MSSNPYITSNASENPTDQGSNQGESTSKSGYSQYRRIGRVPKSANIEEKLGQLEKEFLIQNPPESVGGNLNDDEEVHECLVAAIEYFHKNLPDEIRGIISDKWGITNSMINARKIGFVDDTNDAINHLIDQGFSPLTIARAGIGTSTTLKHLFECNGVSTANQNLVPEERREREVAQSCSHDVDETIETLLRGQIQGLISPEEINLEAVSNHLSKNDQWSIWNWWDNRITFPYKNEEGDFSYIIVRATDKTDDIIYDNGIVDRTSRKTDTLRNVADNEFTNRLPLEKDDLEEYIVLPHKASSFREPANDDFVKEADETADTITEHFEATNPDQNLASYGLLHLPGWKAAANKTDSSRIHLINTSEDEDINSDYMLAPPAIGLDPGSNLQFSNETDAEAELSINRTPNGVWWEGGPLSDLQPLSVEEKGTYKYQITVDGETLKGILIAYDNIHTNRRNHTVEDWISDEPGFDVDVAKYVKQTVDRKWINQDAVMEPIFGVETIHEDKPLIVTEGVTDAIMAHQYNFPCVAPATTNFKKHHYDRICEFAETVSTVFVVNDNEVNDAGINGALRTAKVIENAGHDVLVGELPRPKSQDKIDVANFLQTNGPDSFKDVLRKGIPPENHPKYDPPRHDPASGENNGQPTQNGTPHTNRDETSSFSNENRQNTHDSDSISEIYSLSLKDVIDFDSLPIDNRSGGTIYRGKNPIQHHGNSTGYFVIRDHGDHVTAKDYKIESSGDGYYYNSLTWMACEAECDCDDNQCACTRSVTRPMGSLSNEEIWWVWKHAKEADHIPVPDDDPIPLKAVWHIARKHNVYPSDMIPKDFNNEKEGNSNRLTATPFNAVLEIIDEEYGLDPGRPKQDTE